MGKKKASALHRVKNLLIQKPAAVTEPTGGDENPDLEPAAATEPTGGDENPDLEPAAATEPTGGDENSDLDTVGTRRQRVDHSEADDASPPAAKRKRAYLPEVGVA